MLSNMAERYEKPAENASAGEFVAWIVPRRIRDICRWRICIASHRGELRPKAAVDQRFAAFQATENLREIHSWGISNVIMLWKIQDL